MTSATIFLATLGVAAAFAAAPVALADPLPGPDPIPVPGGPTSDSDCMAGEVLRNGACVSAATSPATGNETRVAAPTVGGTESTTTNSYLDPMHTVPNINGDPCTGQWESAVCYAMSFDNMPAVQPRSTLSSSP
ncbi:MAG: hypothetical protein E6Q56_01195 [Mycobacterium sp.]|nr:MAG: hypothetical protein E6Q56_01195 [Mycobacterium sp.]